MESWNRDAMEENHHDRTNFRPDQQDSFLVDTSLNFTMAQTVPPFVPMAQAVPPFVPMAQTIAPLAPMAQMVSPKVSLTSQELHHDRANFRPDQQTSSLNFDTSLNFPVMPMVSPKVSPKVFPKVFPISHEPHHDHANFPPDQQASSLDFDTSLNFPMMPVVSPKVSSFLPISHEFGHTSRRYQLPWPTAHPDDLFRRGHIGNNEDEWMVGKSNRQEILVYIAGWSFLEGSSNASAGYGVFLCPEIVVSARLEGTVMETRIRAELRAAIVAVKLREWWREGVNRIVLACDSDYVVRGISDNIPLWRQCDWRYYDGTDVPNMDLWFHLIANLQEEEKKGVKIEFWWIPRFQNPATRKAREGALLKHRGPEPYSTELANGLEIVFPE